MVIEIASNLPVHTAIDGAPLFIAIAVKLLTPTGKEELCRLGNNNSNVQLELLSCVAMQNIS